jgi:hypothetical protein
VIKKIKTSKPNFSIDSMDLFDVVIINVLELEKKGE